MPLLLANLPLSLVSALTGIALPIAFSIGLLSAGYGYSPLEAFAAGAALSSTSLGTTLAALNSVTRGLNEEYNSSTEQEHSDKSDGATPLTQSASGTPLQQSRIGTVLIGAAIIDDVIGLIIASLIPALSSLNSDTPSQRQGHLAWSIIRPLLSSLLIAVVSSVLARFVLRPAFRWRSIGEKWCAPARPDKPWGTFAWSCKNGWGTSAHADAVKLFFMVATVSAMATIANCKYAGQPPRFDLRSLIRYWIECPIRSLYHRPRLDICISAASASTSISSTISRHAKG